MPKKCPPGVICFENITLVLFLIIACIIIYLAYTQYNRSSVSSSSSSTSSPPYSQNINISPQYGNGGGGGGGFLDLIPSFGSGYTRGPADVLLNPYTPPLRDDR